MDEAAEISNRPKPQLLAEERRDEFNRLAAAGQAPDLRGANLANLDLRGYALRGLDLSGAYLRGTNLSGQDLTGCNLKGVSLKGARISGVLFPENISPQEIRLSVELGTRIRMDDAAKHLRLLAGMVGELYKHLKERDGRAAQA